MNPTVEKHASVLYTLESDIVIFYVTNPNLTDLDVISVFDALIKYQKAIITNFPLPQNNMTGLQGELYTILHPSCVENTQGRSPDEIMACLKKLKNSATMWNMNFGKRGYLDFIKKHVPI